ncbi:unnamed protein product [Sphagnum troendelagicum]|uniref:Calnexin n=1 Tax=Sphagnum troendelagicum TaxID=128251 RepID=A0ABP0UPE7_9BRYO
MAFSFLLLLVAQFLLLVACTSIVNAQSSNATVFYESFDKSWKGRWFVSHKDEFTGKWKYDKSLGHGDYGLLVSEKAKKHGIAVTLAETTILDPSYGAIVLQYNLRLQKGLECGGAYLKYLQPQKAGWTLSDFDNGSPYSIMFGPDKCGLTNKVHFIFCHKNPKSMEYSEHHLKAPPVPKIDKFTHVYSAIITLNNTLRILIDGKEVKTANLLSSKDFDPPVMPQPTLPDPDDKKPSDWDDRAKIPDPEASKPDDWDDDAPREIIDAGAVKPVGWLDDEPEEIDDPESIKSEDWNDEEDGQWTPAKIDNPKCEDAPGCGEWKPPTKQNPQYKGKWKAPFVENPAYNGIWKPRQIPNPDYFTVEKLHLEPISAIGIEIWTMQDGILFDDILVTHDEADAQKYRDKTWKPKFDAEKQREAMEDKENDIMNVNRPPRNMKEWIFETMFKIADIKFLAPHKLSIIQSVKKLEDNAAVTLTVLGAIPLLLTSFLYSLALGRKQKVKLPLTYALGLNVNLISNKSSEIASY